MLEQTLFLETLLAVLVSFVFHVNFSISFLNSRGQEGYIFLVFDWNLKI